MVVSWSSLTFISNSDCLFMSRAQVSVVSLIVIRQSDWLLLSFICACFHSACVVMTNSVFLDFTKLAAAVFCGDVILARFQPLLSGGLQIRSLFWSIWGLSALKSKALLTFLGHSAFPKRRPDNSFRIFHDFIVFFGTSSLVPDVHFKRAGHLSPNGNKKTQWVCDFSVSHAPPPTPHTFLVTGVPAADVFAGGWFTWRCDSPVCTMDSGPRSDSPLISCFHRHGCELSVVCTQPPPPRMKPLLPI